MLKGTVYVLIATLLWGSSYVVTKGAVESFPAYMLVAVRLLLGGACVALISRKQLKHTDRRALLSGVFLGVLYAVAMMFQTFGIKYTNAGRSAFLTAAYCIIMPFLEWWLMKNKPQLKNLFASLICFAGIGLVALTGSFTVASGDLLSLGGALFFGFFIVFTGIFVQRTDAGVLNTFQLLTAGVILAIISTFTETVPTHVEVPVVLEVLYLAIACTGIPLLLQCYAQKAIPPTLVSLVLGFEAVFAAIFSAIFSTEEFTLRCLVGFALILGSVFMGELNFKKKT